MKGEGVEGGVGGGRGQGEWGGSTRVRMGGG